MMRTLLVTGGAGFIGGNYVLRSLSQDDGLRIVNLDLLTYAGNYDTLLTLEDDERHTFVQGDIADAGLVAELLSEHTPNAIINSGIKRSTFCKARFTAQPPQFVQRRVQHAARRLRRTPLNARPTRR